jgi:hypothetical protein
MVCKFASKRSIQTNPGYGHEYQLCMTGLKRLMFLPPVQVLLPARFLALVGHWVACLTLVLDRVRSLLCIMMLLRCCTV